MADFTPVPALLGGLLVGAGASVLLLGIGRIAGICGIASGLLDAPRDPDRGWRATFLAGLLLAGLAGNAWLPGAFPAPSAPLPVLLVAGVLVGVGTRLANGCTSGHGVCGIGRGSVRSLAATCTFIAAGMLTVWIARQVRV